MRIKTNEFTIELYVNFTLKDNIWTGYNKDLDLKVESSDNYIEAREDFESVLNIIFDRMIKTNRWENNFKRYGLKKIEGDNNVLQRRKNEYRYTNKMI